MNELGYPPDFERQVSPWWKSKGFWPIAGIMIVLHLGAAALYLFASGEHKDPVQAQKPVTGIIRHKVGMATEKAPDAAKPPAPIQRIPVNRAPITPSDSNKPKMYSWKNEKGVRHFSDQPPKYAQQDIQISDAYEHGDLGPSESLARKLEPSYPTSRSSRVLIQENRVLVPVRLGYKNQEILTLLVLDTGASSTTIYRPVASRLHLLATRRSSARVADGRTVASDIGILDYLVVGPHKLSNLDVLVIDFKGDEEISKGLLGMNFLKKVRYDIDFHNQTINWR